MAHPPPVSGPFPATAPIPGQTRSGQIPDKAQSASSRDYPPTGVRCSSEAVPRLFCQNRQSWVAGAQERSLEEGVRSQESVDQELWRSALGVRSPAFEEEAKRGALPSESNKRADFSLITDTGNFFATSSTLGDFAGLQAGFFEPLFHVAGLQGVHHLVQLALHKKIQIVEGETNPVVGHTVLGKIVGANLFLSPARSNQAPTVRGIFGGFFQLLFLK